MYREQARIEATLERIAGSDLDRPDLQLLLVDDGSDDATVAVAEAAGEELGLSFDLLTRPHQGKGAAVAAGMLAARGELIAFVDADLSTTLADIVTCFDDLARGDADVVVATRSHPSSEILATGSRLRQASGWSYNMVLRRLGLTTMLDTQCGLKGFRAEVVPLLFAELRTVGFAFDIEVLLRAQQAGLRIAELPVRWSHVPASRVRVVRDSPLMLRDALRIRRDLGRRRAASASIPSAQEPASPTAAAADSTETGGDTPAVEPTSP